MGDAKIFLTIFVMFIRKKRNRSGSVSVVVVDKAGGRFKELVTIGVSTDSKEIDRLVTEGREWIYKKEGELQPRLDLFGEEREARQAEVEETERVLSHVSNVLLNGSELIVGRVFDRVGFGTVGDEVFRRLVLSRLSYPASKAATAEYLRGCFDDDVSLWQIYRYLDRLGSAEQSKVQDISVKHTLDVYGGTVGVVFYDVTTLYFEADLEDDLRRTGFSKEGRHRNPQIILGLLVSSDGCPLAYCIHPGNKYEGHTMLPAVTGFVGRYGLEDFIVVADSGLMTGENVRELDRLGYKYIIGARIKTESAAVKRVILSMERAEGKTLEIEKGYGQRLLVGYSSKRAMKDAHNRRKGLQRLEKAHRSGRLTKESVNNRGYNKFLRIEGDVSVAIDYERVKADEAWDGLKGYLTNTDIPAGQVYEAYHNLWNVERAFRIAKSKIEIRPMFHFTRRRIEAHVCICFVALKVYKELERILKQAHIPLSVDKVLSLAKTVTTIQIELPKNKETVTKTLIMERHKVIEKLFSDDFWR